MHPKPKTRRSPKPCLQRRQKSRGNFGSAPSAFLWPRRRPPRSLKTPRRAERFAEAERAITRALPRGVELEMFPGVYGHAFRHLLPDVDVLEEALSCRIFRGWPICEVEDVVRMRPDLASLPDWKAWETYISWHRCWISDRWPYEASNYIDFYNRHLKLGEVAACLSHFRLWQKALRCDLDVCIVFEDDARPTEEGLRRFQEEVDCLTSLGVSWDLVYLHSSLYSKGEEPKLEGCNLLFAGHRKWAGAYALSGRGLEKLTSSGYENCIFPVDDFLPALHSFHPRPDVRELPCVRDLSSDFIALTFPDGSGVVEVADRGSVSKYSAVILGDLGALLGDSDDEQKAEQPRNLHEEAFFAFDIETAAAALSRHGFSVLQLPQATECFQAAEDVWRDFFAAPGEKYCGLRQGSPGLMLPLADAGYTLQSARQHFHLVMGAADHQVWPPGLQEISRPLIRELETLCLSLLRLIPGGPLMEAAWRRASEATGDASVWDAFSYFATADTAETSAVDLSMAAHTDPGLLTAKPLSSVAGLEVWDAASEKWISLEGKDRTVGEVVVFSADTLQRWSKGAIPSCRHRVAKPRGSEPRLSLVYEMRILHEGVDLEQMPNRLGSPSKLSTLSPKSPKMGLSLRRLVGAPCGVRRAAASAAKDAASAAREQGKTSYKVARIAGEAAHTFMIAAGCSTQEAASAAFRAASLAAKEGNLNHAFLGIASEAAGKAARAAGASTFEAALAAGEAAAAEVGGQQMGLWGLTTAILTGSLACFVAEQAGEAAAQAAMAVGAQVEEATQAAAAAAAQAARTVAQAEGASADDAGEMAHEAARKAEEFAAHIAPVSALLTPGEEPEPDSKVGNGPV
eukprot:s2911_g2.t4